jgi:Ca-activated chloride channel family protein
MRPTRLFPLVALLLAVPAGGPLALDRPITFKAGIDAVKVSVTVSDARGRYITGLTERDFQLLEDGQPQALSVFAQEQAPVSVTLLMDGSGSMASKLPVARAAAHRLLAALKPEDEAKLMAFNQQVRVVQDMTSDRRALDEAIERIDAYGGTSLYTAAYIALREMERLPSAPARRQALVVLSDGEDTTSSVAEEEVIDLARKSGITVYTVGLGYPGAGSRPAASGAVHFLTVLARDTGGQAHFARRTADLERIYWRIGEELRAQYNLGYVPQRTGDGRWRRIAVRIPARADVLIRHRPGYLARAR